MEKLKIIYNAALGISCPDAACEEKAISMCAQRGSFIIGSQLIIDNIRVLVKQGKMPVDELEIWFGDIKICMDQDGRVAYWPEGFCDYFEKVLDKMLA